jgi:hypothetical protein
MWGTSDAWLGYEERRALQLRELRGAGSQRSSVAADPEVRGRGAQPRVGRSAALG